MAIIWDPEKSKKLMEERNISIEEVADLIMAGEITEILENPAYPDQMVFIIYYKNYIHSVPFLIDSDKNIILKTVYPSRKFNKRFGGKNNETKT